VGPTTYTLSLSASQVATYCNDNSGTPTASVNIISGTLAETAVTTLTGVQTGYQVLNLPQLPAIDQTYSYHGASVFLNAQSPPLGGLQTVGIYVNTPAPQLLFIAVTGCGENGTT
jgi:hypothetical protein